MPIFFVEGHMEKLFLQAACRQSVIRLISNGRTVAPGQIARNISSIYRTIPNAFGPVFVIFDREQRQNSAQEIATVVANDLATAGISALVGVADRCIEAWILHDINGHDPIANCPEGTMGSALKALLPNYSKTRDGPGMLKQCRASVLRTSPSFDRFFQVANPHLPCWWFGR